MVRKNAVSPEARALNILFLRIPAVLFVNRLIVPSGYVANAVLWGCVLPWSMLGLLSKLNK